MDYFQKIEKIDNDLSWNIPETAKGSLNLIGGNIGHFNTEIKIAEFLEKNYPLKSLNLVLPDSLKKTLPDLPNFIFLPSTDSGSFSSSQDLAATLNSADYNLLLGDFSKNTITKAAIKSACETSAKPLLLTRDTIDLIAEENPENIIMKENVTLLASIPQLIKLFRAIYYPKMLLLSEPLVKVAEALHKFTLSYPANIITLHDQQILIAKNGQITALPLINSGYSPISFWRGEPAAKIAALSLYNPHDPVNATISAIIS